MKLDTNNVKTKENINESNSYDGDVFEVDDEVVKEMEPLETMKKFVDGDEDDEKHIPTCAIKGRSLKMVLIWTECNNYFKDMDLKDNFETIISADYLSNQPLLEEMFKKVFQNYSNKVIDEEGNKFEDSTILRLLDDFKRKNEVIVIFDDTKLSYYDSLKQQWITITEIPTQIRKEIRSSKKACVVKDRIYILGDEDYSDRTNVAEYNTQTNSWRTLRNASMEPSFYDVSLLCTVGNRNKLFIISKGYKS